MGVKIQQSSEWQSQIKPPMAVSNYLVDCHCVHGTSLVTISKRDVTVYLGSALGLTVLTLTLAV